MGSTERNDAFLDAMARLNRDLNRRESPPSVQECSAPSIPDHVADTARALAKLMRVAEDRRAAFEHEPEHRLYWNARTHAIADAARACGPQVEAAFRALVTGDAGRAPEVPHA